jgi:hypothetical protein
METGASGPVAKTKRCKKAGRTARGVLRAAKELPTKTLQDTENDGGGSRGGRPHRSPMGTD